MREPSANKAFPLHRRAAEGYCRQNSELLSFFSAAIGEDLRKSEALANAWRLFAPDCAMSQ